MTRLLALLYGVVVYVIFFATFLYLIGFVAGWTALPRSVDHGGAATGMALAVVINVALMAVFGLQHSVMARPGFKKAWTRFVPWPIERSTFVLAASLALMLLFWQWRPMPATIWAVETPGLVYALWAVCFAGWGLLLISTFAIDHFDLFGLRQVWFYFRGKELQPIDFKQPGPYRMVRHPLYLGFVLAFWAIPEMTLGHLLFAAGMTGYILIGIAYEERDLLAHLGSSYAEYRQRVPMLIPLMPKRKPATEGTQESSTQI